MEPDVKFFLQESSCVRPYERVPPPSPVSLSERSSPPPPPSPPQSLNGTNVDDSDCENYSDCGSECDCGNDGDCISGCECTCDCGSNYESDEEEKSDYEEDGMLFGASYPFFAPDLCF